MKSGNDVHSIQLGVLIELPLFTAQGSRYFYQCLMKQKTDIIFLPLILVLVKPDHNWTKKKEKQFGDRKSDESPSAPHL